MSLVPSAGPGGGGGHPGGGEGGGGGGGTWWGVLHVVSGRLNCVITSLFYLLTLLCLVFSAGTPLPFIYTHLVYWIVQILLLVIAISTGINLAVYHDRRYHHTCSLRFNSGSVWRVSTYWHLYITIYTYIHTSCVYCVCLMGGWWQAQRGRDVQLR